ncbi:lysoplasmalogenase [Parahaliea aestuarii]|uniref:Lysoplasmalogenase n=1 Tax=Parahaliea aestuarii TaxID=1852021 RepID=A0A5C9A267_9GAMM|nr:lysoplasmalogenase [Parahaliea aestuarii]TXS94973.1 lysoplasmalogenase [Parahaliea aestuarii]
MINTYTALLLAVLTIPALVVADYRQWRPGRYLCKPLAALAFLALAWSLGALHSSYGQWLLAGLVACMAGDLLLMFERQSAFMAGLGAFLVGHLLYIVAFCQLPGTVGALWVSALPVAILVFASWRWLAPHVPGDMRLAVRLYIAVIAAMLLAASTTWGNPAALWILPGAVGFALSDLAVARQQFVLSERRNGLWGTPLYFVSQLLLAASVSSV